jgi:hypothetical protein
MEIIFRFIAWAKSLVTGQRIEWHGESVLHRGSIEHGYASVYKDGIVGPIHSGFVPKGYCNAANQAGVVSIQLFTRPQGSQDDTAWELYATVPPIPGFIMQAA